MTEPERAFEIEETFDVDADTPVPDWSLLEAVAGVRGPEILELDARYFDTADYALARARYAVRRREGGHDAGWHIKGPRIGLGREETAWPLHASDSDTNVPGAIREHLAHVTEAPLMPIARIRNTRRAWELCDADGGVIAEFVDDQVRARDERRAIDRQWREWEVELGPAAPDSDDERVAFFARVRAAAIAKGAREASSDSKLARALGVPKT